jgi:hypothetical protein
MKSVMCAIVMVLAVPVFAEDALAVRALRLENVKFDFSKVREGLVPIEIKSADDLAKAAPFLDAASREAIKKQVNFEKEKVVVLVWEGSGRDRLAGALSADGKTATFTHRLGLTADLHRHAYVFAVPKDATVRMVLQAEEWRWPIQKEC